MESQYSSCKFGEGSSLSNIDENIRTLVNLGLSNAQAKTYLCLLRISPASIREIANVSKVARPDTYRAIIDLQEAGIVEKIITVPTKYKPLSIMDGIEVLMLQRTKETVELKKRVNGLIESVGKWDLNPVSEEESKFVLIHEGNALIHNRRKLLETSQDCICIMVPWQGMLQVASANYEIIEKALERKVNIRIITEQQRNSNKPQEISVLEKHQNFEIRYIVKHPNVWFWICDSKEILLTANFGSRDFYAVLSNNTGLIELSQNYFNSAWFSAIEPQNQGFKRDRRQFDYLFANMTNGFSYNKMIFDDYGKPIDFVIIEANTAFEEMTGLSRNKLGKRATKILPHLEKELTALVDNYGEAVTSGKSVKFCQYFKKTEKWLSIHAYSPEKGYFATIMEDITERKQQEREIESLAKLTSDNPNPIFRIDGKGIILCSNQNGASFLTMWNSKAGGHAPKHIIQVVADSLESKKRIELEEKCGSKIFSLLFAPIIMEGYVNVYVTDITDTKKLKLDAK